MRKIKKLIIHCLATPADWRVGQPTSAKIAEVKRWHVEENGWADIGYHYLIDRDGTTQTGRPLNVKGAHTKGKNKGSIGIALFGGKGSNENDAFSDNFTPEQDAALRKLVSQLESEFPGVAVHGHNEFSAKACPGFNVPKWFFDAPAEARKTAPMDGARGIPDELHDHTIWDHLKPKTRRRFKYQRG